MFPIIVISEVSAIIIATADGACRIGGTASMGMQKDVSLDPRIGAVQIQEIIVRAREDVVDKMNDWPRVDSRQ